MHKYVQLAFFSYDKVTIVYCKTLPLLKLLYWKKRTFFLIWNLWQLSLLLLKFLSGWMTAITDSLACLIAHSHRGQVRLASQPGKARQVGRVSQSVSHPAIRHRRQWPFVSKLRKPKTYLSNHPFSLSLFLNTFRVQLLHDLQHYFRSSELICFLLFLLFFRHIHDYYFNIVF